MSNVNGIRTVKRKKRKCVETLCVLKICIHITIKCELMEEIEFLKRTSENKDKVQ